MSKEFEVEQSLTEDGKADTIPSLLTIQAQEKIKAWQVVWLQIASILIVSGVIYVVTNTQESVYAVLSGGATSICNGILLAWRMMPTTRHLSQDAHQQLWLIYFYAIERYLLIVVLLGVCFVVLKFAPLLILSGFVIGQFVLLVTWLFVGKSKINSEYKDV
ncbi:MAG: ATP synthase subunit I [Gallionella sp.]